MPATDPIRAEMIALLPRLRAFARSLTRAQDTADDLVQATCEKALRNLGGFTPGTRLDAWLFRIMRNAWIDTTRARRDHTAIDDLGEGLEPAGEDGRAVVMARLELADVARAVDALPEEQRSVLMLVCVEGMRYREAAEALGIPEGTVMSRLARGRAALVQMLDGNAARSVSGRTG
ncbi:MAG TPA: RNA polymerase sigma factor [Paracoccaceae bacterium]|nr:RNA polymerase sigma factor [Paracoccaceae bacterium]HMO73469.1 RNA polymerase sigma factor [Paracoccaceae bacterium]